MPAVIEKYHVCVVKNMRLDSSVISLAKRMKLIMQFGVGLEGDCCCLVSNFDVLSLNSIPFVLKGVDVDAATRHGIKVARIPGDDTGNAASCAEMAIYLMLGLLRKQVGLLNLGLIASS